MSTPPNRGALCTEEQHLGKKGDLEKGIDEAAVRKKIKNKWKYDKEAGEIGKGAGRRTATGPTDHAERSQASKGDFLHKNFSQRMP